MQQFLTFGSNETAIEPFVRILDPADERYMKKTLLFTIRYEYYKD